MTRYILIFIVLISVFRNYNISYTASKYDGQTAAAVTLAGGVIKNLHSKEDTKKYKRKDCPVCKGKGWYLSGDGIKKIECLYCEPENSGKEKHANTPSSDCKDGNCKVYIIRK